MDKFEGLPFTEIWSSYSSAFLITCQWWLFHLVEEGSLLSFPPQISSTAAFTLRSFVFLGLTKETYIYRRRTESFKTINEEIHDHPFENEEV
jgi:hypothetical protein